MQGEVLILRLNIATLKGNIFNNQNSIQEEINIRMKSGNARFHSMQNPLSSSLLSKNIKIKIYGTIFCLLCMGVKIGLSRYGRKVG
jgi:hypothetical protein